MKIVAIVIASVIMTSSMLGFGRNSKLRWNSSVWRGYLKKRPLNRIKMCLLWGGLSLLFILLKEYICGYLLLGMLLYVVSINFYFPGIFSFDIDENGDLDSFRVWYKKKELVLDFHKDIQGKFVWNDLDNTQDCVSFKSGETMGKVFIPYKTILAVSDYLYKHDLLSDEML